MLVWLKTKNKNFSCVLQVTLCQVFHNFDRITMSLGILHITCLYSPPCCLPVSVCASSLFLAWYSELWAHFDLEMKELKEAKKIIFQDNFLLQYRTGKHLEKEKQTQYLFCSPFKPKKIPLHRYQKNKNNQWPVTKLTVKCL